MKERVRAFGYVRVSGKGQVEGHGFDRQEEEIQGYAARAGYEIVNIFREEGISGTKDEADRPAFQEMIATILKDGVRTIIIEGMDRLAREMRIQETLLTYLAAREITLISARTEDDVTASIQADPMKKAMIQIQGVFSELDKNLIVKKLRNAREKVRAERGKCEGQKSYLEIAPEIVQEVKRLRRKPKLDRRLTFVQVAEILNQKGLRTAKGKEFTGQIVQNILRNK